ncbi:MAG: isoprenoid biosynthesis glyoxalase ElbB [Candidatus Marinimicrobia bacterium]|nr:isoprenoid biosynthesis glyoxalase ElbB [Candidatus Neomarinimicrobiota bacterium]
MMKKIAVILAGSGRADGSEIQEAVLTLLALDKRNVDVKVFAPNIQQMHVINHLTDEESPESRNVMVESARIFRGDIQDIKDANIDDFDAIVLPGGFGAAKNLCNYAMKGLDCEFNSDVENFVVAGLKKNTPIGFICIWPVLGAFLTKKANIRAKLTIGNDKATAEHVEKLGNEHIECEASNCIVDEKNSIVSTPAYMIGKSISEVSEGIDKLVGEVIKMC